MLPHVIAQWKPVANAFKGPLETDLILAVIWQESLPIGNPWSFRYESRYQYFYDAGSKRALYDKTRSVAENREAAAAVVGVTEFNQQSASWGLMQVMGAVARELGMEGYLTRLCDPNVGVKYGCKHLINFYNRAGGDLRAALWRYNGGSDYPNKVLAKLDSIREG